MARKTLPSGGEDDNWESLEAELFGVEYGKEHRPAEMPQSTDDAPEADATVEFDDSAEDFDTEPQDGNSAAAGNDDSLVEFEEDDAPSFSDAPVAEDFDSTGVHPTSEPPRPTGDDPYWDALSDWNWDDPNSSPARAAGNESDDGGVAPPRADRGSSDRPGAAGGRRDDRSGKQPRGRGGRGGRDDRRAPRPPRSGELPAARPVSPVDDEPQPVSESPASERPVPERPVSDRPATPRGQGRSERPDRAERPERGERGERAERASGDRTTGERTSGERAAGDRPAGERTTGERTERPRRDDGRRERGAQNRRGSEPAEPRVEDAPRSDAGRGNRRGDRPRTPPVVPAAVEFDDDDFGGGLAEDFSPVRPVSESRHPADDLDDTNGDDLFGDDLSPLADDASDLESPLEQGAASDDRPRRRRRRRGRGRGRGGRPGDAVVSGSGDEAEDGFGPDDSPVADDSDDFAADERDIDPRGADDAEEADDPWSEDRPAARAPAGGRRGGRGGRGGRDDRGGNRGPRTERPSRPADFGPDDDLVDEPSETAAVANDDDDDEDFEPAVNYSNVPTWEEAISYLLNPQLVQVDARESGSAPKGGIPQVDRPEPRAPERTERPEPRGEQRPPEPRSDRPRGGQRPPGRRRN